jgi:two-component system, cell cycle sensor histidine kinase and response regulator CckA
MVTPEWIVGGGETGELIRTMDWSKTPLGLLDNWPQTLRTVTNMVLSCAFPMAIVWEAGLTLLYNDAYRVVVGDKHPDAMGRSPRDLWPQAWGSDRSIFEEVLEHGRTVHLEDQLFRISRETGWKEAYFTLSYSPIRADHGAVVGALVTLVETTDRVMGDRESEGKDASIVDARIDPAEGKRREGERAILNATTQMVLLIEPDGTIVASNQALAGYLSRTTEDMIGKNIYDFLSSETAERRRAYAEQIVRGRRSMVFEEIRFGRWVQSTIYPIFDDAGEVTQLAIFAGDIHERKQAERALKESEERFKVLVEEAPEAIFVQANDRIHYANPAMASLLGASRTEDLLGRDLFSLIAPEYHEAVRNRIKLQRETGKPVPLMGKEYLRFDGTRVPVETTAVAIRHGDMDAHLVFVRDVRARMETEDALRDRERRLQAFFDAVDESMILIDKEDKVVLSNLVGAERLGKTVSDLVGTRLYDSFPPEVATSRKAQYDRVIATGRPVFFEDARLGRSFEQYGYPVVDKEGVVSGVAIFARDVSGRKEAEEALRKSEEKYRSIFENAVEGFYQTTPEGRFVGVNPALARMMGFDSTDEMVSSYIDIGREHYENPGDRMDLLSLLEERGYVHSFETRLKRKDGEFIWVSISGRAVRNGDGKTRHYEGTVVDITERYKAEEALRRSEEMYRTLIAASPDAITVCDLSGRISLASRKALELFGISSEEEAVGRSVVDWIANREGREAVQRAIHELLSRGGAKSREFFLKKSDGAVFQAEVHAAPIRAKDGSIRGAVLIARDVTERNSLQAQLLQSQKMEAVGTLAGGVAHDFNNILMAMMGYLGLLRLKLPGDHPLEKYVGLLESCASKAANVTRGLLAFSRRQNIELKPQGINVMVRDFEKLLRRLIPEDVHFTVTLGEDATIMADITQIDQVLINLVSNAKDAMPKGGSLTVETKAVWLDKKFNQTHGFGKPGNYGSISVTDTGSGMDEETLKKIFEPFFTTKETGKGTGLGLSIVYGIIKQHNGYVTVASEPGKGTKFSIYLPAVKAEASRETKELTAAKRGSETILLAEDDVYVREIATELLQVLGYRVIEAEDGEEAVRKYSEHRDAIDLLILDVVMPVKNGKAAYDEIRAMNPSARAIFMSGYTGDILFDRGVEDVGLDYITKPLSTDELLAKVREVLDR